MKKLPGPLAPPLTSLPSLKMTALSYSLKNNKYKLYCQALSIYISFSKSPFISEIEIERTLNHLGEGSKKVIFITLGSDLLLYMKNFYGLELLKNHF